MNTAELNTILYANIHTNYIYTNMHIHFYLCLNKALRALKNSIF